MVRRGEYNSPLSRIESIIEKRSVYIYTYVNAMTSHESLDEFKGASGLHRKSADTNRFEMQRDTPIIYPH